MFACLGESIRDPSEVVRTFEFTADLTHPDGTSGPYKLRLEVVKPLGSEHYHTRLWNVSRFPAEIGSLLHSHRETLRRVDPELAAASALQFIFQYRDSILRAE